METETKGESETETEILAVGQPETETAISAKANEEMNNYDFANKKWGTARTWGEGSWGGFRGRKLVDMGEGGGGGRQKQIF